MKFFYPIIYLTALVLLFALSACGQSPRVQRLYQSCANSTVQAEVRIENGDIILKPCVGKKAYYKGLEIGNGGGAPNDGGGGSSSGIASLNGLTGSTQTFLFGTNDAGSISSTGTVHTFNNPISAVSGAARTGFMPYFDAANTLGKSFVEQTGNKIRMFPANINSTGFYSILDNDTGLFFVGDGANNRYININSAGQSIDIANSLIRIGKFPNLGNDVLLTLNNSSKTISSFADIFSIDNQFHTATADFSGVQTFSFQKTVTTAGTTGARTINKPAGTVNFAPGANSLVVTNSTVSATSIIQATARSNDATCGVKNVVAGAGTFTINMSANCTAETSVGFLVTN